MTFTTDPSLKSFVPVEPDSHFPIQNLPYGAFRRKNERAERIGVAIGGHVLDLALLEERGLLPVPKEGCFFNAGFLNRICRMLDTRQRREVRERISQILRHDNPTLRDDVELREKSLIPIEDVELRLPVLIGNYTDFYSSREHATNVGTMLRGAENALNPNWLHLPVAYHGRASSVVVSGTDVRRPLGQTKSDIAPVPVLGPSKAVDFELEVGYFIGQGNELGMPIPVGQALDHVIGLVLVNDWSARDIQKWEYVPLGPFLAKNFVTSISPWVVPLEALEPFRVPGPEQRPEPLPYLRTPHNNMTYDIHLEVLLQTKSMSELVRITRTNFRYLYWSIAQKVEHHTVHGCNLQPVDLLATGTISGPDVESRGCLLERTWGGSQPIELPNGEIRRFLEDGDRITITGWCQGNGYRVGFGEVTGQIVPAPSQGEG